MHQTSLQNNLNRSLRFSLTELLIVTAILAILMSLLQPSMSKLYHQTGIQSCKANLKNLGMAYYLYTDQYDFGNNMLCTVDLEGQIIKDNKGKKVNSRSYLTGSMIRRGTYIAGIGNFVEEGLINLDELECPSSETRSTSFKDYKNTYPMSSSASGCRVGYEYRPPINYKNANKKYEHPSYLYETVEQNLLTGRAIINCYTDKTKPKRLIHDLEGMCGVLIDGSSHYFPNTVYNQEQIVLRNRPNDFHEPIYDELNKASSEIATSSSKHKL